MLQLKTLEACSGEQDQPSRAAAFTSLGEVFRYIAREYSSFPKDEAHVFYFVISSVKAYKSSLDCDATYENRYPAKRALELIAWHIKWMDEAGLPKEIRDERIQQLDEVREGVLVPTFPEVPECPEEVACPKPKRIVVRPKQRGYTARYGGRYSLAVETGLYAPIATRFNNREPENSVAGLVGFSAGWRIPKNVHVVELGGRVTHTFGQARPYFDYTIGLLTFLGGYFQYGAAPLEGKVSFHTGIEIGGVLLPDRSGANYFAPTMTMCVVQQTACFGGRLVLSLVRDEHAIGVVTHLSADILRIADVILQRKAQK